MEQDSEDGLGLEGALRSPVAMIEPPAGTNMARELYEAFRRHEDKILLVDTASGRKWTGAKLLDYCARLSSGLARELQFKPNQTVMTICDHDDQEIATALGLVLAGGALFGTQPGDGYQEVKTLCEIVRPQVLLINSKYHTIGQLLRQEVSGLSETKILWLDGANENTANSDVYLVEELISQEPDMKLVESIIYQQIQAKQHTLTYMLTSGSTGRPKVVPSTHEELIYGLFSMISASTNGETSGKQSIDANNNELNEGANLLPHGPDEIVAGDLPLDHGAGLNTMFLSLWLGAKFIVMPSYDVDAFWQAVSDYQVTFSISSTTFCYKLFARLKQLIDSNDTHKWRLDSFKYIACCGAKLAFLELVREVQQHFRHIQVSQAYGCTEIGFISVVHLRDCYTHLHSVGTLFPGLRAKVIDPDDESKRQLGPGKRGELLIWARSKFKGYRCQPEDNAALIYADCHDDQGLFYRTGDQAHVDSVGRIHVHGRFKDTLVLMEDWKILPSELEEVINEHPLVEMSAVVGVPDPNLPGCHAPRAFVKLLTRGCEQLNGCEDDAKLRSRWAANDLDFVARHIYEFAASRTARPKHLTGGVRILPEFPRVGLLNKVDRKALKMIV